MAIGANSFDAMARYQQISDQRVQLANQVTGQETPAQLAAIQAKDKALSLAQAAEEVSYQANTALDEANKKQSQKNMEQRARLLNF